jgi:hypothetical protein
MYLMLNFATLFCDIVCDFMIFFVLFCFVYMICDFMISHDVNRNLERKLCYGGDLDRNKTA